MNHALLRRFPQYCWILLLLLNFNNVFAQSGTVSVDFNNATPEQIIKNLESRTPYRFVYPEGLDLTGPGVTLKKENVSIDEVLQALQAVTNLNFKRTENNIAVNKKQTPKKKGKVTGKVVDAAGLSLPGASILIIGTPISAVADMDGNYSLTVDAGSYTIEFSFMSFQTQKVSDVVVTGDTGTVLNIVLQEDAKSLDEVVITTTYKKATATAEGLLLQQKNAIQFSDGISAQQIAQTPDNEVGSALKRINGVTTVDDKYVVVRSMGERWNQAVMDGVNLPSTDAYQQHFSFDIIPTALVESIVVSKSATPDMNANFAGGLIEVKTKDIPRENFTVLLASTSYNSRSTFQDQVTKQRGSSDYFGFDDGTRDFPKGLQALDIPVATNPAAAEPFLAQSRRFTQDNFTNYTTNTPLNSFYQLGIGRAYQLENNNRWGFVAALNVRNTQSTLEIDHTERGRYMENTRFYAEGTSNVTGDGIRQYSELQQYGYKNSGASYTYNSTVSGMFNAGLQLGKNRFSFRNTYMHIYENQLTQITGWDTYGDNIQQIVNGTILPRTETTNYPVYQLFNQHKIDGNHKFGAIVVDWFTAYSHTAKDTKDATFMTANRNNVGDDVLQYFNIYNSGADSFRRENYWNKETDINWGASGEWNFDTGKVNHRIKAGYFGSAKQAENQQERAVLRIVGENGGQGASTSIYLTPAELLDGSQYAWGGFGWEKISFYGNKYEGKVAVHAPFAMLDHKLGRLVRLVWGLRAESFVYTEVSSQKQDQPGDVEQLDDKTWQYMPSVSLTVSPRTDLNVRLGYNKSVLRPQFAERLGIPYYDPVRGGLILANSSGIVSSVSDNYDFKIEWFPAPGEILSFGAYHKAIDKPIEAITQIGSDGARYIFNMNSHSAKLSGIEMEVRKNLTFLGEGKALESIFLSGNATLNDTKVTSFVNLFGTGGTYEANRPLYGQTTYAYNLGLDYTGERIGFSIRHNGSGDQYLLVGYEYRGEEIRRPYATTDAQVYYKFFKDRNFEVKFSTRNLFDSTYETYNNQNSYSKIIPGEYGRNPRDQFGLGSGATKRYDEGIDRIRFRSWVGRTLTLSLNYTF